MSDAAAQAGAGTTTQNQGAAGAAGGGAAGAAGTEAAATEPQTYTAEEYSKQEQRAKRFESQLKDTEVKYKALEAKLSKFDGIDLEELQRAKAEKEKLEAEARKNNPEELEKHWQGKLQKREKELGEKITSVEQQLAEKDQTIKELRVTNVVMGKISHRFNPDVQDDLQTRISRDGDFQDGQIVFKDADGSILTSKKTRGEFMSPEEYGDHLAALKPSWAKAEATGGSKAGGTKAPTTGASTLPPNFYSLSKEQQTKFFRENPKALDAFNKAAG